MQLSIIVPVGNLTNNTDSIRNLIDKRYDSETEIIFVLDNLTISDIEIVRTWTIGRNEIKILTSTCGSPGGARNQGLKVAKGKWIVFWDCDDNPIYSRFLELIKNCELAGANLGVGSFRMLENNKVTHQTFTNHFHRNLRKMALNPGIWRLCILASDLKDLTFNDAKWGEDQNFILKLIKKNPKIYFSDLIVYEYSNNSITSLTSNPRHISDIHNLVNNTLDLYVEYPVEFHELVTWILLRQLSTIIKYRNYLSKNHSIIKLIRKFFTSCNSNIALIYLCFLYLTEQIKYQFMKRRKRRMVLIITGGFGNQLFQLAAALYYSDKTNSLLIIEPSAGRPRTNEIGIPNIFQSYQLKHFKIKNSNFRISILNRLVGLNLRSNLNSSSSHAKQNFVRFIGYVSSIYLSILYKIRLRLYVANNLGYVSKKILPNSVLIGYFQSYIYSSEPYVREQLFKIRNDLSIGSQLSNLKSGNNLVVHIRRGDYLNELKFGVLSKEYYHSAIEFAMQSRQFTKILVFSDEEIDNSFVPEDYRDIVLIPEKYISGTNHIFEIMRYGSGFVLANSTFSWWAATLSYNPNPFVIAPFPWFAGMNSPKRFYPPGWIKQSAIFES